MLRARLCIGEVLRVIAEGCWRQRARCVGAPSDAAAVRVRWRYTSRYAVTVKYSSC